MLADLDPDDPRTPSQQIANALRAAILRGLLAAGDKLPSQHELAGRYGVARETVKAALRILDREQLVVSRQGSGVFVRARRGTDLDLQGLLRSAFDRPHVSIDYAGFRGESLAKTLIPSLNEIAAGTLSAHSLRLRLLLVDPRVSTGMPVRVANGSSDRALRTALGGLTRRSVKEIVDATSNLKNAGLLQSLTVEVRVHKLGPSFKIYVLNNERVLFGFYPVTEHSMTVRAESVPLYHPSGWDAALFGATDVSTGPQISGPPFTEQAQSWFESVWSTIAEPYEP